MTLTIELTADEESRFQQQAHLHGQNGETLAHSLVRAGLGVTPASDASEETTVTDAKVAALHRRLLAAGLMTELPTHPGQTVPFQPITVLGPPVSQTIIEDRE